MSRKMLFVPLLSFLALASLLLWQLLHNAHDDDPTALESVMIGKPMPVFQLGTLQRPQEKIDRALFTTGKPVLLNVWATWCPTCREEHPFLRSLAEQGVNVVGLNYKDDRLQALTWLEVLGNPYRQTLYDARGTLGLDLGVYGTPETFLVDGNGIIRYRHAGGINQQIWLDELKPRWQMFSKEAAR